MRWRGKPKYLRSKAPHPTRLRRAAFPRGGRLWDFWRAQASPLEGGRLQAAFSLSNEVRLMRWKGYPLIFGKPPTSSTASGPPFAAADGPPLPLRGISPARRGNTSRGRLGLPLAVSKPVHLFRDAGGPCGSVDSFSVFNPGDDTCGPLSAFLPPFVARYIHLGNSASRNCGGAAPANCDELPF